MTDWKKLIDEYGGLVWKASYRLLGDSSEASECFQETFAAVFELSRQQRIRNMPALLSKVATTKAIDRIRKMARENKNRIYSFQVETVTDDNGPERELEKEELAGRLRMSLGELPPLETEVFCLRYFDELSYRQIARQLEINRNTVGVLLHRARKKLKSLLDIDDRGTNE